VQAPKLQTGSPAESTVVVFEKRPRWTPELQRQFLGQEVHVRMCRSLADIEQILDVIPSSVVIVELDAAEDRLLPFLARLLGRVPSVVVIAVVSPRLANLEWLVREFGVIACINNSTTGGELAKLCNRQWCCERKTLRSTLRS